MLVIHEIDASTRVARLRLNRPEARNATSIALLDAMDQALDAIEAHRETRVLVLSGEGPVFCAGLDLAEARADRSTIFRLLRRLSEVMRRLRRMEQVTIAVVRGAAIGGGFGFAVVCDFAVTHPEAKLGYPPPETGLSPALMAPWLARRIGHSATRAMQLKGGTINGNEALSRGLVSTVVPVSDLDSEAQALAAHLLRAPEHASRELKRFLNELDGSIDDAVLDRAADVSASIIAAAAMR